VAEDDCDDAALTSHEVFLDSKQAFLGALSVLAVKNLLVPPVSSPAEVFWGRKTAGEDTGGTKDS
jgi:hypothetical protein